MVRTFAQKKIQIENPFDEMAIEPATEETLKSVAGFNIPAHDERVLGYTDGALTTVTYKLSGVTVATKTLTYTGGILTGVAVS